MHPQSGFLMRHIECGTMLGDPCAALQPSLFVKAKLISDVKSGDVKQADQAFRDLAGCLPFRLNGKLKEELFGGDEFGNETAYRPVITGSVSEWQRLFCAGQTIS